MEKEDTEILDNACKNVKVSVTRHSIDFDLTNLLKRGLTSTSAGGFFFIPYLLQLNTHQLLSNIGKPKTKGIPKEKLALGIVFESLFGYTKGVRSIDSVSKVDFGLLSGLPFLPSPSTQYCYLQNITTHDSLNFQVKLGKQLLKLGQISSGNPLNIDGHNIKTYSRKEMKRSFITQEDRYGKAIRTFYVQDQVSDKPILAMASYSGTKVAHVTEKLAVKAKEIYQNELIFVADKEWYCGKLIEDLFKKHAVSILTPVKRTKNRIAEFESIPLKEFEKTYLGNIAAIYTVMTNYEGPLRMFLKKQPDNTFFALITPQEEMGKENAMCYYTKRWGIEGFFNENHFLGVDQLPSLNLNAIQAMLSFRMLAFQALDNFRHDLGVEYKTKTPKSIYRMFIDGVQGRLQLKGNTITVHIYGFEHENAVAAILTNMNSKLERANIDPRIPWLGNRCLEFKFF